MSVKKSNVKIDNNGKLFISKDGELKEEFKRGIELGQSSLQHLEHWVYI